MPKWPSHYLDDCPPNDAYAPECELFRFTTKDSIGEQDFASYYEMGKAKNCKARGLSVFLKISDCERMAKTVPSVRKMAISKAALDEKHGVIKATPSRTSSGHHTFWSLVSSKELLHLFYPVDLGEHRNV